MRVLYAYDLFYYAINCTEDTIMAVDFSKLGTKTKMFRGDDSVDFLFPTTNVNQIPVFFKKFFIDGFDTTNVTSAVANNGVLTITTGTEFKATMYKVVAIAGASNALVNKEYRVMKATNKTTFELYAPDLANGTYTGSITVKFAPLGWELVAETSTAIAIRSKVAPYNRYTLIADWSYKSVSTASFVSAFMQVVENFSSFAESYTNLLEVPNCAKRAQVQWNFSASAINSNTTTALDASTTANARWETMKMTYWLCGDDKVFYGAFSPLAANRLTSSPAAMIAFGGFNPFNLNERHPMIFQGTRWSSDSLNSTIDGTVASTQWYSPYSYSTVAPTLCGTTYPNAASVLNAYANGQANGNSDYVGGSCFLRGFSGLGGAPVPCSVAVLGAANGAFSGGTVNWETTYFRAPNVHLGGIPLLEPQLCDYAGLRGVPFGMKFIPSFLGDVLDISGYTSVTKVVEVQNSNIVNIDEAEAYIIGNVNTYNDSSYGALAFPLKDWS